MKTIDINELKALYQVELDDAHTRTVKMISDKDLSNCNLEDAYGAMLDWNIDNQRQMELFDDFINKSLNTNAKEEIIVAHKSNDSDIRDIAKQDMRKFNGNKRDKKNKDRKKAIRKTMRDDAMKQLSLSFPFSDLNNDEVVKDIWLNSKAEVRNNINDLMESINLLREIERYIQLSNNYNDCK
jgi:hypothetical protein